MLWAVDLDQDGQDEVLRVSKSDRYAVPEFFKRDAQGSWQRAGSYDSVENAQALIEKIRQGDVKVVKPRYQSLQVEGVMLDPRVNRTLEP